VIGVISTLVVIFALFGAEIIINGVKCVLSFDISALIMQK
jgi:hypothetical protein